MGLSGQVFRSGRRVNTRKHIGRALDLEIALVQVVVVVRSLGVVKVRKDKEKARRHPSVRLLEHS